MSLLLLNKSGFITPVKRSPLPPFDKPSAPSFDEVYITLPPNQLAIIPSKPRKDYFISNWWTTEVKGLPFVPGASSEHPEMLMTYILPYYPDYCWQLGLETHARNGMSHFCTAVGPAIQDMGWSIKQFVDHVKIVKQYIPYSHVMLAGKGTGHNDSNWDDPNGIRSYIEPVLKALLDADAIDTCAMFETNAWNIPGNGGLDSIIFGIKELCGNRADQWLHFTTYETSWQEDGITRGQWWERLGDAVKGILYQGDVSWDVGFRQSCFQTTTNKPTAMPTFASGQHKFVACELDGESVFDLSFSEDISNLHGFEYICTPGIVPIWGTCSGIRYPDGSPILKTLNP